MARTAKRAGTTTSERPLAVLKQFRTIYGSVRKHFRQVEAACGVSASQLWVLHEIDRTPSIGISALALRLSIHQTTCSQLVEKLVERGFVRKTRSDRDQRRVGLALTPAARKALKAVPGPAEGLLPSALRSLPDETLTAMQSSLERLIRELKLSDPRAADRPLAEL